MTEFTPTEEQLAIVDAAKNSNDNLLVSALAGAAKTSTLVLIAEAQKSKPMLCLAFNKKIATEMEERLPGNCTSKTLNGLGHAAWGSFLGKRLILNTKKTYDLVLGEIQALRGEDKDFMYSVMSETMKMVDSAKTAGYVPTGRYELAKGLMDDDELFNWFDEEPDELQFKIIKSVYLASMDKAMKGEIDFNDQILMPTVMPAQFPQFPVVLVDEAQDLSALNHKMLRKIAKGRLIAVGDECQAIYGFRGAHQDSMRLLQETFNMKKLILSISFRCPQSIVKHAQWRAPHMRWPEWAKEGVINTKATWDNTTIPDHAAVICRNNAPLFRMAMRLLKAGRYPQLIGNDIGKSIVKQMRKFGVPQIPQDQVFIAINSWKEEKLKKSRSPGSVHDQAACMMVFAEQGRDLGEAIAYAEHIFASNGPIQLMTGHKSKGLEFEDVFILDRKLINIQEGQEKNLLYVMQTRSKNTLTYIETEGYTE